MEQSELFKYLVTHLEQLDLKYLITGSMATITFGEPRFTNGIDVVVRLSSRDIGQFCKVFPLPEFSLSEEAIREAVRNATQFNIIHPTSVYIHRKTILGARVGIMHNVCFGTNMRSSGDAPIIGDAPRAKRHEKSPFDVGILIVQTT